MPRGRPKGSKNKRQSGPVRYSIGSGTQYEFPIVREGNVRGCIATLVVGGGSFAEALKVAVAWAKDYSAKQNETRTDLEDVIFWPLVRYRSNLADEKRFVSQVDVNFAYAESRDAGAWLPIQVLEAV